MLPRRSRGTRRRQSRRSRRRWSSGCTSAGSTGHSNLQQPQQKMSSGIQVNSLSTKSTARGFLYSNKNQENREAIPFLNGKRTADDNPKYIRKPALNRFHRLSLGYGQTVVRLVPSFLLQFSSLASQCKPETESEWGRRGNRQTFPSGMQNILGFIGWEGHNSA